MSLKRFQDCPQRLWYCEIAWEGKGKVFCHSWLWIMEAVNGGDFTSKGRLLWLQN